MFALFNPTRFHYGTSVFESALDQSLPSHARIVVIIGKRSLADTRYGKSLIALLARKGCSVELFQFPTEPTVDQIDQVTAQLTQHPIDYVVAVGGGSVLDAGKALSAMIPVQASIADYLEGSPAFKPHSGKKIPFIALPTTAGTGSELTKNAVISDTADKKKRSLRHDALFPDIAIVDPELTLGCPKKTTAASGMDALTQLIEAYTSKKAHLWSDALVIGGIEKMGDALVRACTDQPDNIAHREKLSLAASISGWALSQVGLGLVHGFASSIGGIFEIPHGVICARLLPAVISANISEILRDTHSQHTFKPVLEKYGRVARALGYQGTGGQEAFRWLPETLQKWLDILEMPTLSKWGMTENGFKTILAQTSQKENPVTVPGNTLERILRLSL